MGSLRGIVLLLQLLSLTGRTLAIDLVPLDDDEWQFCSDFLPNCLCATTFKDTIKVNCDGVVFPQDFPSLPSRQPITEFSWREVKAQNVPPQTFIAAGVPLEKLFLGRNHLRRLSDKSLEGLAETLITLDLSHNLLGDQLNPIFSSQEISRLPRLRELRLGYNSIRKIDNGLLQGALSLQELNLDGNELSVVPSEALSGPKALRTLSLENNTIQTISGGDFARQRTLLHLNLNRNQIHSIGQGAFAELGNLKILLLEWNHIQRINSDAFGGLDSLEELSISSNFLRELPRAPMNLLPSLKRLQLAANLIHNVSADDFASLRRLHHLNLSRNRLTTIPENTFKHLTQLITLDLSVNQLRTIPKDLFHGLSRLTRLDLSDNNLLLFPMEPLRSIPALKHLLLDFNRISAIQSVPTANLTSFSIGNNLIRHIPPEGLKHLLNLQELHLQGNQLESVDELHLPHSLLLFNVSRNNLTTIPRLQLPILEILDVSNNNINEILSHNFLLLPRLQKLHLQVNAISKISQNAFQELLNLEHLDMSENYIQHTQHIEDLPSLRVLNLSSNHITAVRTLPGFPSIHTLDISRNKLTQLQEPLLRDPHELAYLYLQGNGLNSFRGLDGNFTFLQGLNLARNKITYVFPQAFQNISAMNYLALDFSHNELTFFPTEALPVMQLSSLSLSHNLIRHIHDVSFSNFPRLRKLELQFNAIETLPEEGFRNSSQLQFLDLSNNKIEVLGETLFHGLLRLELNLANNFLSSLPQEIFSRRHVMRLHSINLSNNALSEIPTVALQPQIFFLEKINVANNSIKDVPPNSNVLVNVKDLDISSNPLSPQAQFRLLSEPKTTRTLRMAQTNTTIIPTIEIPFLRHLDLSGNEIRDLPSGTFQRTTLLHTLLLGDNPLTQPPVTLPSTLADLDLSGTDIETLKGHPFPVTLQTLILNRLGRLIRLEKSVLNLPLLRRIELGGTPKLGYIDIRGILQNLHFLEAMDFEVKDGQILDQLHPALSPRLSFIALRGKSVRSVSTGALAGLSAPSVQILFTNTSLSTLPPILVPVPASSLITIDLSDSNILNISPPVLSQNIRIVGINPHCDCNAIHLINYLKSIHSAATCSSPPALQNFPVLRIRPNQLLCTGGSEASTAPTPRRAPTHPTFPTERSSTTDDIIWSIPETTPTQTTTNQRVAHTTPKQPATLDTNAMDNLILGIVGGVVGLLLLFVLTLLCCLRKNKSPDIYASSHLGHHPHFHQQGKCRCPRAFAGNTIRSHHSLHHHPLHLKPIHHQPMHASLPYFIQYEDTRR